MLAKPVINAAGNTTISPEIPTINANSLPNVTTSLAPVNDAHSPHRQDKQPNHFGDKSGTSSPTSLCLRKNTYNTVEAVVPCSLLAASFPYIPHKKRPSTSSHRGSTSLPCTANLKNHKYTRHHNRYSPLSDHMWDDDGDGETWISDSNASETEHMADKELHEHQLNMDKTLDWGNMAEDEPFQSWEARADAQFEATIARNDNAECRIQLQQADNSSILNQNFPPLREGSPVTLYSHESKSSQSINTSTSGGSEYAPSPLKTRAQRQKKGQHLSLTKQLKTKKAANRELKALSRGSKTTTHSKPSDPDEFQWLIYEKDKKKREDDAATANNSEDQHQWKVCVYQKHRDTTNASGADNHQHQPS